MKHVALVFPMVEAHLQQVVNGITDWVTAHGQWQLTTLAEPLRSSIRLMGWQGDGVIAALTNEADILAAADLHLPCVNISGATSDQTFPRVNVDNAAIGRLAAEHLLACGFRRIVYYGVRGLNFSDEREAAFLQRVREESGKCEIYAEYAGSSLENQVGSFDDSAVPASSLARIHRPFAVFAVNDTHARQMISACAAQHWRVPDDVAVLGVDNDLVACESAAPSLSSIACDWRRIGYEAALTLQRQMDREEVPQLQRVAPIGLVRRKSTDVVVIDHIGVAAAMEFVRQHIHEVFGVEALLSASKVPRRSLEIAFEQSLGCTPYEYITRARVARAKEMLLARFPQTLTQISRACGFSDLRRFRMVFRREVGMSPARYRQTGGQTEA